MGLELLKTTWDVTRHVGPDQKVLQLPVLVLQSFEGWFKGRAAGCHHYILFKPGRTADKRLPCAASFPAGAPNTFASLAPLAVSACLQWMEGTPARPVNV
jgi:hypothetical protein